MVTVTCILKSKRPEFTNGTVDIPCSEQDAPWIKGMSVYLGAHNHPCVQLPDGSVTSLARQVLQRYGVPVNSDDSVYRVDTTKPLDVSHENLCVPLNLLPIRDCLDGVRSVVLADWLSCFININKQQIKKTVTIQCLNADTIQPVYFTGDEDDLEWLEGCMVRFNSSGIPLVQSDWGKFTPISAEQVKIHMPNQTSIYIRHLAPDQPLDIRKHLILTIAANGRMWTGMANPQ